MSAAEPLKWVDANQAYLVAAIARVRRLIERRGEPADGAPPEEPPAPISPPSALERICAIFGLTAFERDVLVMCAGVELDATFTAAAGGAQPTFGLALAALPDAHWSALSPSRPLRSYRLIELAAGAGLTTGTLRIDERILHELAGVPYLDERLAGILERVPPAGQMAPAHAALAERAAAHWKASAAAGRLAVVQLCGRDDAGKRQVAAACAADLGLGLLSVPALALPPQAQELETLTRLAEREAALSGSALLVDCVGIEGGDEMRVFALMRFLESASCPLFVFSRERLRNLRRPAFSLEVERPPGAEQRALWSEALGPGADVEALAAQFNLSPAEIRACAAGADAGQVWDACRARVRVRLDDLAQRIGTNAAWKDLVVPEAQQEVLRQIAAHLRRRVTVYETWGFGERSSRGLGITALFFGPSGTGKTMAAEVLANELRLDLYRIDLSQVVSKYIGETEKNLRRVFDAAEECGAILLFDEADALFGRRSEVRDSHDRYANVEVSYLLQRMEAYRGLAILTTNMKQALDPAFLRRIRFSVEFPFPDTASRESIWRGVFPEKAPLDGIEWKRLAKLDIAGGNIFNIAVNAAFLAANEGAPIGMRHILAAARTEYAKLEKPLSSVEIGGCA